MGRCGWSAGGSTGWPHWPQNWAEGDTLAPHLEQNCSAGMVVPQAPQNLALADTLAPQ
jgi:hypothetical protein